MSYETEEQQLERLKEWWSENGTPLVVGAILGLAGFGGWKYWNAEKAEYETAASDAYKQVVSALEKNERDAVLSHAEKVVTEYSDSTYAILAAMIEAKQLVAKADYAAAREKLQWILDHHKRNELAHIARLRLARVMAHEGKLDEALALLKDDKESAYYAMANWIKGELLLVAGREDEALAALKIAAEDEKLRSSDPTLQLKIDQLEGGAQIAETNAETRTSDEGAETQKEATEESTGEAKKGAE